MRISFKSLFALAAAVAVPRPALAQEQTIRITPSGAELYRMAVTGAKEPASIVTSDLALTGYFNVLDPKGFPSTLTAESPDSLNGSNWMQVGAQGVLKIKSTGGDSGPLQCLLYEVAKADRAVLSKRYVGAARLAAHQCASDVVKYLTGEDGFFDTEIAFAAGGRSKVREIFTMDFDGANVHAITKMNTLSMLPSWSSSGGEITFLSYLFGPPDLWAVASSGGRARRLTKSQDAISAAAWAPDGSRLAATLTRGGNADIYLLSTDGKVLKRLTDNPAIDTSPAFSPDGSQIAFVSSRGGSPQIYVMNADGGGAKRLTYQGNYNQTPRFCPRKDMPLLAFTARDEHLHFDIFTIDLRSGQVARITQSQGDNEEPTWAPNCRVIAYRSSRGGIWVQNPSTRVEHQIYRGAAEAPRWGPSGRR